MRKYLAWFLVFCLCLVSLAWAEEEEISFYDALGLETPTPAPQEDEQANESAQATPENYTQEDGSVVILISATGDVTIGRNGKASSSIFENELKKQNGDKNFIFRNVKDIFEADDLTIINFEGTLTEKTTWPSSKNDNEYLFRADPAYAQVLPDNGVEAVALENNHVMDYGEEGFEDTKANLTAAGVVYAAEDEMGLYEVKGVKIAMLAYQTFGGRHQELAQKVVTDVANARQVADIVIVSYHWGNELDYTPNENQVMLGRATIDAGADLVLGHHSHRINPIEYYNGKYICYSLGNFSFAGNSKPDDMSTYIFQTKFRVKDGEVTPEGFIIIPCRISSRTDYNDFAPTPYEKEQNITSLLSVLDKNGKSLNYAAQSYPLSWD